MAGAPITPAVQVAIQDASGNTVTTATTSVTVAIGTNPASGTLSGTTTVSAVNGMAAFTNLRIDKVGTGYTLTASGTGLTGVTSSAFTITVGSATQLVFRVGPSGGATGVAFSPAAQVGIQDGFGNSVTTATNSVTVAIGNNPSGGTLSGTTAASAVSGVATFSNLSIDRGGSGYTLTASATGLTGATSSAFSIAAPPAPSLIFATIAAGGSGSGSHTCGVTTAGAVYCWGYNGNGQLGDNSSINRLIPTLVQAPPGVTFQAVSPGGQHTCAVTPGGDAYCWGRNEFGRLGDGTGIDRRFPVRVAAPAGVTFAAVSPGNGHSCGLAAGSGSVYCWGLNGSGQLGDNTNINRLIPVLVQAPAGVTFTAVTTGVIHSCGLAVSGAVYCWGDNGIGQLGDNSTIGKPTPVQALAPVGVTFARVDAGFFHTCAVTPSGAAYCWGANSVGQLGDNTTVDKLVPTAVQGGLQFALLSGGGGHTCGVTTTGLGHCWGVNSFGQIGDNTTLGRLTPAANAGGLSLGIPAAGPDHSCALATGTIMGVYCWGNNGSGQLGDGTTTQRLVPTRVIQ